MFSKIFNYVKENTAILLGCITLFPIICGVIIINNDLSKYKLMDYNLFQLRSIYAGIWFLFLLSIVAFFNYTLWKKCVENEGELSRFLYLLIIPGILFYDFLFLLCFITNNVVVSSEKLNGVHVVYCFIVLMSFASLLWHIYSDENIYFHKNSGLGFRITIQSLLIFTTLFAIVLSKTGYSDCFKIDFSFQLSSVFTPIYFISAWFSVIFILIHFKTQLKKWAFKKGFGAVLLVFLFFVAVILSYSNHIYPNLPENLGGGIKLKIETTLYDNENLNGTLVYRDNEYYYILLENNNIRMVKKEDVSSFNVSN